MIDVKYIGGVSPLTLAFPERTLTVSAGETLALMDGEADLIKARGDFERVEPEQPLTEKKSKGAKRAPAESTEAPDLSATEPEEASK